MQQRSWLGEKTRLPTQGRSSKLRSTRASWYLTIAGASSLPKSRNCSRRRPTPDAAKRRRWTRLETVAWIASRDHGAIQVAAKVEARTKDDRPANLYSYLAGEGALHNFRLKGEESNRAGKAIADAIRQLEAAEIIGDLVPDDSGRFRVAEIKKLFPSREGRGMGQLRRDRMSDQKVVPLGRFFLTNRKRRSAKHNWHDMFNWCKENDLATSEKQYKKLRAQALRWAGNELALRRQADIGVNNSKGPLTPKEYEQCRQNLASWRKPKQLRNRRANVVT